MSLLLLDSTDTRSFTRLKPAKYCSNGRILTRGLSGPLSADCRTDRRLLSRNSETDRPQSLRRFLVVRDQAAVKPRYSRWPCHRRRHRRSSFFLWRCRVTITSGCCHARSNQDLPRRSECLDLKRFRLLRTRSTHGTFCISVLQDLTHRFSKNKS